VILKLILQKSTVSGAFFLAVGWSREHGAWGMGQDRRIIKLRKGSDPPAGGEQTDSAEIKLHGDDGIKFH